MNFLYVLDYFKKTKGINCLKIAPYSFVQIFLHSRQEATNKQQTLLQ